VTKDAPGWSGPRFSSLEIFWILTALVVGLVVLAFLLGITAIGLTAALVVQPINFASLLFNGLRTRALSNGDVDWWSGIKGAALASSLLYVLPSRLSELAKPIYLAERCGINLVRGVALLAVERFIDICIVASALGLGLLLLATPEFETALATWGALTLVGAGGCIVLVRWPALLQRMLQFIPWRLLRELMTNFVTEVRSTLDFRRLPAAITWGTLTWISSFLMLHTILFMAGSQPISLSQSFLVFLAGTVGIAIAIAPGGLGTYEVGIVVALKLVGYATPEALALSLLIRAGNLGITPVIAVWTMLRDGVGMRRLMEKMRSFRSKKQS